MGEKEEGGEGGGGEEEGRKEEKNDDVQYVTQRGDVPVVRSAALCLQQPTGLPPEAHFFAAKLGQSWLPLLGPSPAE